ncbi:MAG: hypothetical protein KDC54_04925, partial [Lewinella sp.]|nr:hypothetical protein [Lewinella sp.]
IAEEQGYRYNYHGRIRIEFPIVNRWQEMTETAPIDRYAKVSHTLQPNHTGLAMQNEGNIVSEAIGIRPDQWYTIELVTVRDQYGNVTGSEPLRAEPRHNDEGTTGLARAQHEGNVYQKFAFVDADNNGQYEIYSLGHYQQYVQGKRPSLASEAWWSPDHNCWGCEWKLERVTGTPDGFRIINIEHNTHFGVEGPYNLHHGPPAPIDQRRQISNPPEYIIKAIPEPVSEQVIYSLANADFNWQTQPHLFSGARFKFVRQGLYYQIKFVDEAGNENGQVLSLSGNLRSTGSSPNGKRVVRASTSAIGPGNLWDVSSLPNNRISIVNRETGSSLYFHPFQASQPIVVDPKIGDIREHPSWWLSSFYPYPRQFPDAPDRSGAGETVDDQPRGPLMLKTEVTGTERRFGLSNMTYDQVPEYVYIMTKSTPHRPLLVWSNAYRSLAVFHRTDPNVRARIIENVDFPLDNNTGLATLSQAWEENVPGYRNSDLATADGLRMVLVYPNGTFQLAEADLQGTANNSFRECSDCRPALAGYLPYQNRAQVIPGRIELSRFDWGGPGMDYSCNYRNNGNAQVRLSEGVDINIDAQGNLYIAEGAATTLSYSVNIQEAGSYLLSFRYSHNGEASQGLQLSVEGVDISNGGADGMVLPPTGGAVRSWYQRVIIPDSRSGEKELSVRIPANVSLYSLEFERVDFPANLDRYWQHVIFKQESRYLDVDESLAGQTAPAQPTATSSIPADWLQEWSFTPAGAYYSIVNRTVDRRLADLPEEGPRLQANTGTVSQNQLWEVIPLTGENAGHIVIRNVATQQYLRAPEPGSPLVQTERPPVFTDAHKIRFQMADILSSTVTGPFRLVTMSQADAGPVIRIENLRDKAGPKYIYICTKTPSSGSRHHPIAIWSRAGQRLAVFDPNQSRETRELTGVEFPADLPTRTATLSDWWTDL